MLVIRHRLRCVSCGRMQRLACSPSALVVLRAALGWRRVGRRSWVCSVDCEITDAERQAEREQAS